MRRELTGALFLAVALLTVAAGPAAAGHEEPTKVFETTVGDAPAPTTGVGLDDEGSTPLGVAQPVDAFEVPERFDHWYATVTEKRIDGAELFVDKFLTVETPSGDRRVVDNSGSGWGKGVELCHPPALACSMDTWDGEEHWDLADTPTAGGAYELRIGGLTTAEYTVAVFGFDAAG